MSESSEECCRSCKSKSRPVIDHAAKKRTCSHCGLDLGSYSIQEPVIDSSDDATEPYNGSSDNPGSDSISNATTESKNTCSDEDTIGEEPDKGKAVSEKSPEDEEHELASDEDDEHELEVRREPTLTSRQRALASASGRSSAIEFPDGLVPATRKKKESLSATEQQLKKAEAARKRKDQVDKANKEATEKVIRKILGQDSSRKKREDEIKKRQDKLAQEKAAREERASTDCIRTIIGPSGTTVSFPTDKVPSLFDPKPSGYPPPREKCAGPGCINPSRYSHSKLNVPLCSLACYKAVEEQHKQNEAAQEQQNQNEPA